MQYDINVYKNRFLFKPEDYQNLVETGKILNPSRDKVYAALLEFLKNEPRINSVVNDAVLNRVSESKDGLWSAICEAKIDNEFFDMQVKKAYGYSQMGIPFEAYYEATIYIFDTIEDEMLLLGIDNLEAYRSFRKIAHITEAILVEAYHEIKNQAILEQSKALMELSTPVTQLWEGILLLPLVGYMDTRRAQDTMSTMLEMVTKSQAKMFILDISGIAVVDTAVANHLIKMTKATKLMGCHCIISGIAGSVAQTIVELGIDIHEIHTTGSMQDALKFAMKTAG